jgi:hypothetical protein
MVLVVVAAILMVGLLPRLIGLRPYGEQALTEQIEREDSAQCVKFGFAAGSEQYSTCKVGLAAFGQRHEDLLVANSWR